MVPEANQGLIAKPECGAEIMQSSTKGIDLSRIFQKLNNLGFEWEKLA